MNKIEQMHLDAMYEAEYETVKDSAIYKILMPKAASNCLKVTEQIAIEFAEWCNAPNLEDLRQGNVVYVPSGNFYWHKHKKYTPNELFQEFLKTKQ